MTARTSDAIDPTLDLVLERIVDVPPERVWRAWTTPERVKQWFTPRPWSTVECEIDLRPGGIFRTVMRSPEGDLSPNLGTYLEVVPNERLVWTVALGPGFRPLPIRPDGLLFTAIITFERHGAGTKYRALVRHCDAETAKRHHDMGFHDGWGAAFDQLVELERAR